MNVRLNQKIKVTPRTKRCVGHLATKERFGRIIFVNKNLFIVRFKNYKECFNLSDVINPSRYNLKVWTGREWAAIN